MYYSFLWRVLHTDRQGKRKVLNENEGKTRENGKIGKRKKRQWRMPYKQTPQKVLEMTSHFIFTSSWGSR